MLLSPSSGHVCELQHLWGTFLTIKVKSEHKFPQDRNTGSLDFPPDICTMMHVKHDCVIVYSATAFWDKPRQYCSTWQCSTYRLSKDCLFIFILPAFPSSPICLSVIQAYLHSMNIIHRDLNSHNCLVREVRTCLPEHFCVCADIPLHIQHVFFKDLVRRTCHSLIQKQKRALFAVAMGD